MGLFDFFKNKRSAEQTDNLPDDVITFWDKWGVSVENRERRQKTHASLRELGISYNPYLPFFDDSKTSQPKDLEQMCRRAMTALLVIQVACDVQAGNYDDAKTFIEQKLADYGLTDNLNQLETRIMTGQFSEQDVIDMAWTYESYWSLVWALGLIDDICDASTICDCDTAIRLVSQAESLDGFMASCRLRPVTEILDMLDLYYNYHWAVRNYQLHPEDTHIGNLNPSVVWERRRGLEWLLAEEQDWQDIELHT